MNSKKVFASNLKKYMTIKGKSRKDVCNDLGISYYTFSDWVNAKKYPRIDKIEILSKYFEIPKSSLIEDENIRDELTTDITEEMRKILEQLHTTDKALTVDGNPLDENTRELLILSLENSLKMAKMINAGKD